MKNHIVCLSTTNYHPLPTRKQNVMSRLRNSEILYFDPPVSLIAPLKDKKASAYIEKYKQPGEKVEGHENITVYALPPVLPFFNKFRWINKINQKRQAAFIREKMREHGFGDETVLWCYSPSSCDIVEHLPHAKLVYDCVDRHSAYKGHINPKVVDKMECDLAKPADQVFATAVGLGRDTGKDQPDYPDDPERRGLRDILARTDREGHPSLPGGHEGSAASDLRLCRHAAGVHRLCTDRKAGEEPSERDDFPDRTHAAGC